MAHCIDVFGGLCTNAPKAVDMPFVCTLLAVQNNVASQMDVACN